MNQSKRLLVKLALLVFIAIGLQIPVMRIQLLITERHQYKEQAHRDVSDKWGTHQELFGPILVVPIVSFDSSDKLIPTGRKLHVFPSQLDIVSQVDCEKRKRSIYAILLYRSTNRLSGTFDLDKAMAGHDITSTAIDLSSAFVVMGVSDISGIGEKPLLKVGGRDVAVLPGTGDAQLQYRGFHGAIDLSQSHDDLISFDLTLSLKGSDGLHYAPTGASTSVFVQSDWSSPSFNGAFLPEQHDIGKDGFTAKWHIQDFNRNLPSAYILPPDHQMHTSFGTAFVEPVNHYLKNTRAVKYSLLIIGMCFFIYFMFEVLAQTQIHPLQYAFIGVALAAFYLLLLSLTEHIGFSAAYMTAAIATIGMIFYYTSSVLYSATTAAKLVGATGFFFLFVYIVIQLEHYALLVGSIGTFTLIALAMSLTRHLDWYGLLKSKDISVDVPRETTE